MCTHMTSLTFDLISDQEQLPNKLEKNLSQGKKLNKPSGEQQRRTPLQDDMMSCDQKNRVTEYDRVYE